MSTSQALLDLLTPYTIPTLSMERWGSKRDGGYVVPGNILKDVTVLVTGGVANNVEFEADVTAKNPRIRIGLFDHTIAHAPDHTPSNATWHKLGLGSAEDCVSLESAAELAGARPGDTLAVKFDIEGAEWELIESTPQAFWDRVAVLITEYHHLDRSQHWEHYCAALERLNRSMILVHIHANNYVKRTIPLKTEGVELPITIEATYVNRTFIPPGFHPKPWKHAGPTKLDSRNNASILDIRVNYWAPRKNIISRLGRRAVSNFFPWRFRKNILVNLWNLVPERLRRLIRSQST